MATNIGISLNDEVSEKLRQVESQLKALGRSTEEAGRHAEESSSGWDKLNESVEKLTAIGSGAAIFEVGQEIGEKVMDVFKEAIAASNKYELMAARLSAQLKATGYSSGMTTDKLKELADTIQSTTGVQDEQVMSAESLLLTYKNLNGEGFEKALKLSVDMGQVFGNTESAARTLGMALNDPATGLSRLTREGIKFTKTQQDQIKALEDAGEIEKAQGIILNDLQERFGGVAEEVGDNGSMALQKFSNSWDDLMKKMGKGLMDVIAPIAEGLSRIADQASGAANTVSTEDKIGDVRKMLNMGEMERDNYPNYDQQLKEKVRNIGMTSEQIRQMIKEQSSVAGEGVSNMLANTPMANLSHGDMGNHEKYVKRINDLKEILKIEDQIEAQENRVKQANARQAEQLNYEKQVAEFEKNKLKLLNEFLPKQAQLLKLTQDLSQVQSMRAEMDNSEQTNEQLDQIKAAIIAKEKEVQLQGTALGLVQDQVKADKERQTLEKGLSDIIKDQTKSQQERAEAEKKLREMKSQDAKKDKKDNNPGDSRFSGLNGLFDVDAISGNTELKQTATLYDGIKAGTELMKNGWGEASNLMKQYYQQQNEYEQARINQERTNLSLEDAWEKAKVAQAKANGQSVLQAEANYAAQHAQQQQQIANKEKTLKQQEWQQQHDMALASAIAQGALATVVAFGATPAPLGLIEGSIVAGLVATQIAMIASQSMPQFADGGVVPGNSFYGDKILARLNSGELVLNQEQQKKMLSQFGASGGGDTHVHFHNPTFVGKPSDDTIKSITDAIKLNIRKGKISADYANW